MSELFTSVEDLAERIPDGAKVAMAPDYSGCSMVTARALIARGARNLHLIGVPSVGFQGDMLIGAGCVETLETAAVTLDEYGPAPRFMAAASSRRPDPPSVGCLTELQAFIVLIRENRVWTWFARALSTTQNPRLRSSSRKGALS